MWLRMFWDPLLTYKISLEKESSNSWVIFFHNSLLDLKNTHPALFYFVTKNNKAWLNFFRRHHDFSRTKCNTTHVYMHVQIYAHINTKTKKCILLQIWNWQKYYFCNFIYLHFLGVMYNIMFVMFQTNYFLK